MKVEPRDDAEVEERRQRLLIACDGFRAHDEHLKQFFNKPPLVNNFMQSAFGPLRVYVVVWYDCGARNIVFVRRIFRLRCSSC